MKEFNDFLLYCPISILELGYETRGRVKFIEIKTSIHSNEKTHHNRPHVHIELNNNKYVCSIDSKIQIIEPEKCPHGISRKILSIFKYPMNLSECRKEWNKCETLVKFTDKEINFDKIQYIQESDGIKVII